MSTPRVERLLQQRAQQPSRSRFLQNTVASPTGSSAESFVPKDGSKPPPGKGQDGCGRNAERDFHGEKRKNDTHSSTSDPDARLFRKGAGEEAKLCHMGHLMMENRNGLIIDARLPEANGTAERTTALEMIEDNAKPGSTVGGDKDYDTADFVAGCANAAARRTSRRTTPIAARPTIRARFVIPAIASAR